MVSKVCSKERSTFLQTWSPPNRSPNRRWLLYIRKRNPGHLEKQSAVARSSADAEYRAMAQGICELLWSQKLLEELRLSEKGKLYLYCDNLSCANSSLLMPHPCRILQKYTTFGESDTHQLTFLKSLSNIGYNKAAISISHNPVQPDEQSMLKLIDTSSKKQLWVVSWVYSMYHQKVASRCVYQRPQQTDFPYSSLQVGHVWHFCTNLRENVDWYWFLA